MTAYNKEWRHILFYGALYVILAHTGLIALAVGVSNDIRVLGFPLHYFAAIVLGSFGVLIVSVFWNFSADRLEDEIEAENAAARKGAQK